MSIAVEKYSVNRSSSLFALYTSDIPLLYRARFRSTPLTRDQGLGTRKSHFPRPNRQEHRDLLARAVNGHLLRTGLLSLVTGPLLDMIDQ